MKLFSSHCYGDGHPQEARGNYLLVAFQTMTTGGFYWKLSLLNMLFTVWSLVQENPWVFQKVKSPSPVSKPEAIPHSLKSDCIASSVSYCRNLKELAVAQVRRYNNGTQGNRVETPHFNCLQIISWFWTDVFASHPKSNPFWCLISK